MAERISLSVISETVAADHGGAPNYHRAADPARSCDSCGFGDQSKDYCRKYHFTYDPTYTCDSWKTADLDLSNLKYGAAPAPSPKITPPPPPKPSPQPAFMGGAKPPVPGAGGPPPNVRKPSVVAKLLRERGENAEAAVQDMFNPKSAASKAAFNIPPSILSNVADRPIVLPPAPSFMPDLPDVSDSTDILGPVRRGVSSLVGSGLGTMRRVPGSLLPEYGPGFERAISTAAGLAPAFGAAATVPFAAARHLAEAAPQVAVDAPQIAAEIARQNKAPEPGWWSRNWPWVLPAAAGTPLAAYLAWRMMRKEPRKRRRMMEVEASARPVGAGAISRGRSHPLLKSGMLFNPYVLQAALSRQRLCKRADDELPAPAEALARFRGDLPREYKRTYEKLESPPRSEQGAGQRTYQRMPGTGTWPTSPTYGDKPGWLDWKKMLQFRLAPQPSFQAEPWEGRTLGLRPRKWWAGPKLLEDVDFTNLQPPVRIDPAPGIVEPAVASLLGGLSSPGGIGPALGMASSPVSQVPVQYAQGLRDWYEKLPAVNPWQLEPSDMQKFFPIGTNPLRKLAPPPLTLKPGESRSWDPYGFFPYPWAERNSMLPAIIEASKFSDEVLPVDFSRLGRSTVSDEWFGSKWKMEPFPKYFPPEVERKWREKAREYIYHRRQHSPRPELGRTEEDARREMQQMDTERALANELRMREHQPSKAWPREDIYGGRPEGLSLAEARQHALAEGARARDIWQKQVLPGLHAIEAQRRAETLEATRRQDIAGALGRIAGFKGPSAAEAYAQRGGVALPFWQQQLATIKGKNFPGVTYFNYPPKVEAYGPAYWDSPERILESRIWDRRPSDFGEPPPR